MKLAFWVLALLNAWSFLLFGADKLRARRGARRVSEARLLLHALLLGAPGAWLGVLVFRHKSSKASFLLRLALVTLPSLLLAGLALGSGATD